MKMRDINWREKVSASALHFVITLMAALAVAAIIFFVWFPAPLDQMMGGQKLFLLVAGCDLILGPLISLVIYNSKKSRRELVLDYALVGGVQLAALLYGVSVVADSRPAFVVFVKDRFEVVAAMELDPADFKDAQEARFRSLPWRGPVLVVAEFPASPSERSEILLSALAGKDIQLMPKYYRAYESQLDAVRGRALPVTALMQRKPDAAAAIKAAVADTGLPDTRLRWLPVKHRFGFWVALIDVETARPLRYLPIDPY
jgi:hypothetical protein